MEVKENAVFLHCKKLGRGDWREIGEKGENRREIGEKP